MKKAKKKHHKDKEEKMKVIPHLINSVIITFHFIRATRYIAHSCFKLNVHDKQQTNRQTHTYNQQEV